MQVEAHIQFVLGWNDIVLNINYNKYFNVWPTLSCS